MIFPANASLFASLKDKHLQITKATPVYSISSFEAKVGSTLSNVSLPDNFSWNVDKIDGGLNYEIQSGNNHLYVIYTPSDTVHYEVVYGIEITVVGVSSTNVFVELYYSIDGINPIMDNTYGNATDGFEAVYNGKAHYVIPYIYYMEGENKVKVDLSEFSVTIRYNNDSNINGFIDANYIGTNDYEVLIAPSSLSSQYILNCNYSSNMVTKYNDGAISIRSSLTVDPVKLGVKWNIPTMHYDGEVKTIDSSNLIITNALSGISPNIEITTSKTVQNAGAYTATATIKNTNYVFNDGNYTSTYSFSVSQAVLNIVWSVPQNAKYTGVDYSSQVSYTLTRDGEPVPSSVCSLNNPEAINAGNYTVTATLASTNYVFSDGSSKSTYEYTVGKADINGSGITVSVTGAEYAWSTGTATGSKTPIFTNYLDEEITVEGEFKHTGCGIDGSSTSKEAVTVKAYVTFVPSSENFNTLSFETTTSVKAVAYIGSTFYATIEYALSVAASTSATDKNVFVILGTNPEIHNDCEIASGVTLNIPYAEGATNSTTATSTNSAITGTCNNIVTVKSNIVVTNEGIIEIGGILSGSQGGHVAGHTADQYCKVVLEDNSQLNSTGIIKCFGYIEEATLNNGSIVNINAGNLYMPFVLHDFGGGSYMYAVYTGIDKYSIPAFNQFGFINITSKLHIAYGSSFIAWANLYAGDQHNFTEVKTIGNTSEYMIQLTDSNYSYVDAKYNPATGICDLDIFGGANSNSMSLKIKVLFGDTIISTEKVFFPLSWRFDISLNKNTNQPGKAYYNMNQKFKLMTGSKFTVESGTELTIEELIVYSQLDQSTSTAPIKYPSNLSPAILVVNGTLKATNLAGKVLTEKTGACLEVTGSTSITSNEANVHSGSSFMAKLESVIQVNETLKGYKYGNNNTLKELTKNVYYGKDNAWIGSSGTITYNPTLGSINTTSTTVTINGLNGYTIPSSINNTIPTAPNAHYTFGGWYIDEGCSKSAVNEVIYGDIILYAKWDLVTYNIKYQYEYPDDFEGGNIENEPTQKEFNYLTSDFELTKPTLNDYKFDGWYLNTSYNKNELLTSFDVSRMLELVNSEKTVTLYARWLGDTINVNYVTNNTDYANSTLDNINATTDALSAINLRSDVSSKNNDTGYYNYFLYWYYIDSNGNEIIVNNLTSTGGLSSDILQSHINNLTDITLYAKWEEKVQIVYHNYSNAKDSFADICATVFIRALDVPNYKLPVINNNNDNDEYPYYFYGWYSENSYVNQFTDVIGVEVVPGSIINIYGNWVTKLVITFVNNGNIVGYRYELINNEIITLGTQSIDDIKEGNYGDSDSYTITSYKFIGWNTDPESQNYAENSAYYVEQSLTLYAQYEIFENSYYRIYEDSIDSKATVTLSISNGVFLLEDFTTTSSDQTLNGSVYASEGSTVKINYSLENNYEVSKFTVNGTSCNNGVEVNSPSKIYLTTTYNGGCVIEGTLITLSDGSQKPVEELIIGDEILVFNHFTGKIETSKVLINFHNNLNYNSYDVLYLFFSDGTKLGLYGEHYLFNRNINKYVSITPETIDNYLGETFYSYSFDVSSNSFVEKDIQLISYDIINEYTKIYGPTSYGHLNYFGQGLLNINGDTDAFINIFELDDNMKVDEVKMNNDILKYGTFSYKDFENYVSLDIYETYQGKYLKVAIGKGLTSMDRIYELINKYVPEFERVYGKN